MRIDEDPRMHEFMIFTGTKVIFFDTLRKALAYQSSQGKRYIIRSVITD